MKNCPEKEEMVGRFDAEIAVAVVHSGKDVGDSEYRHFLTSVQHRGNIQRCDSDALSETAKRNQTYGLEKTGFFFDETIRKRGGIFR